MFISQNFQRRANIVPVKVTFLFRTTAQNLLLDSIITWSMKKYLSK